MKSVFHIPLVCAFILLFSCKNIADQKDVTSNNTNENNPEKSIVPDVTITPISHATFIMQWDDQIIYVDPVGGAAVFDSLPPANMILVTDIHGDHLNAATLQAVTNTNAQLIAPQAVADKLGNAFNSIILNNDDTQSVNDFSITAIPMYNITEGRLQNHPKGRGNGYVIEKDGYRVYISGDTEGIEEMRNLKDIDKALVCMNLPYTMDVEQAADAVLDFAPVEVIPYHYRGTQGLSDVDKFQQLIENANPNIKVTRMEWYPNR